MCCYYPSSAECICVPMEEGVSKLLLGKCIRTSLILELERNSDEFAC